MAKGVYTEQRPDGTTRTVQIETSREETRDAVNIIMDRLQGSNTPQVTSRDNLKVIEGKKA